MSNEQCSYGELNLMLVMGYLLIRTFYCTLTREKANMKEPKERTFELNLISKYWNKNRRISRQQSKLDIENSSYYNNSFKPVFITCL